MMHYVSDHEANVKNVIRGWKYSRTFPGILSAFVISLESNLFTSGFCVRRLDLIMSNKNDILQSKSHFSLSLC